MKSSLKKPSDNFNAISAVAQVFVKRSLSLYPLSALFLHFISSFFIIFKIEIVCHFPNTLIIIKCLWFLKLLSLFRYIFPFCNFFTTIFLQKGPPLPKICHTYSTMMKLGTVVPTLPKEDPRNTWITGQTPDFCWHQHFFTRNQQILLY